MLQPISDHLTDEMLLDGLKKEQNSAFQAMYLRYEVYVRRYVLDNSGTEADSQDVFQEALAALVQHLRKPDFSIKTNVGSFFQAIVRNWWLYKLRSRKHNVPLENAVLVASDAGEVSNQENVFTLQEQLVDKVFGQITEECQKLIRAFYIQRKPLTEIAAEMSYSNQFVKQKKMRCMNALKDKVFGHPDYRSLQDDVS